MLALLGKLKLYGYAIGAGLIAALWIAVKVLSGRLEDAKYEATKYKHQVKQRAKVDKADAEIAADTDSRTREIAESIEQGKPVESLSDPNRNW